MADDRFVPKSAGKSKGSLALIGALAGAGTLFVWGCTDNSGNGKFVEPNRPLADGAARGRRPPTLARADAATEPASDGASARSGGPRHRRRPSRHSGLQHPGRSEGPSGRRPDQRPRRSA